MPRAKYANHAKARARIPGAFAPLREIHPSHRRIRFYTLRSWPGTEFLVIFLGAAGGAAALLLPRWLLPFPLGAVLGLGLQATERELARAAFTYAGGTEAWYLARYVRSRGLSARFDFRKTFSPDAGLPAVVGVRLGGGVGHFIPVLALKDGQITFANPLHGEERLPLPEFLKRYEFTGFHLVIRRK